METATEDPSSFSGTCAECGSAIPADAVGGHCPLCLFELAGSAEEEDDALECFRLVTERYPQFEFDEDRDALAGADFAWRGRLLEEDTAVILRLRDAADDATAPLEECRRRSRIDDPHIAKMHACGEHGRFIYTIVSEPPGDRLSDAMRQGRLSRPQVDRIYRKVREAWNRACEQGITLGTTPGNIILRADDGLPVLTGLDLEATEGNVTLPALALREGGGDDPLEGSMIGNCLLVRKIGEGGFGLVYSALQSAGVKRSVALKIIKAGMDTRQVVARFEVERQALALMEHPNIAQVFDAGETEEGRPYFVMELVKDGIPVSEFCIREELDIEARLRLFVQICQGVQHAHLKGMLHRDLKPSNILVTCQDGEPVPKVIDFGIAKAIHQDVTDATLLTRYEQVLGTPAYMSPEQATLGGGDVDTRSDVYALGVLLYEMLTGAPPFEADVLKQMAFDEMVRTIRHEEPPKPSSRLQGRAFSRDLDWIVMKALEKDPERRYETAGEFARDINRFLTNEPVVAGPPGVRYRMSKFVRRNRVAVVAATVVMLAILSGTFLATWGFFKAAESEEAARAEAQAAQAFNQFLREDLLMQANPTVSPDRDLKLRDAVDSAAEKVSERFARQPLGEADARMTLARVYAQLEEQEKAREQARLAAESRERVLGPNHADTIAARRFIEEAP